MVSRKRRLYRDQRNGPEVGRVAPALVRMIRARTDQCDESRMAVRLKTLVGQQNPDKRFCRHDHAARSPLCRAYCAGKKHGAVYALTVQPALFGALSLARLGPDWHARTADVASVRQRELGCPSLPRCPPRKRMRGISQNELWKLPAFDRRARRKQ